MAELVPLFSLHQRMKDPLAFSFSSAIGDEQSSTILNAEFMYSQLIVDVLLEIKPISSDRDQFIQMCQDAYRNNEVGLRRIDEFIRDYQPASAVLWYTDNSFMYRLLNKAFRLKNIDALFLFRFFIRDLFECSQELPCAHEREGILHVYRGQALKSDELDRLRTSVGGYISLNSFISTSRKCEVAKMFAGPCGILFDIKCHSPHLHSEKGKKRSCRDISSMGHYDAEEEVLFMPGSVFRIDEISNSDDGCTMIKLVFIEDHSHDYPLRQLHQHIENNSHGERQNWSNLLRLGLLLKYMGVPDKGGRYFKKLLNNADKEEDISEYVRCALTLHDGEVPTEETLACFLKELEKCRQACPANDLNIIHCHCLIGETCKRRNDFTLALEHCQAALRLAIDTGTDHWFIATRYRDLGYVYEKQGNSAQLALDNHYQALAIQEKHLPKYHAELGISYRNIAMIHYWMKNYEESLRYLLKTLEIQEHSLTPTDYDLRLTYWTTATCYNKLKQYAEAKHYYSLSYPLFQRHQANDNELLKKMERIIKHNDDCLLPQ